MPKTANEMKNRIKSLKSKLSCGYDRISTKLLKICTKYLSTPRRCICHHSTTKQIFMDCLKYWQVRPLYKKGEKSCISSYRQVSLLTAFSNISESCLQWSDKHLCRCAILIQKMFHCGRGYVRFTERNCMCS